jgi:RimJ/RimL family protein N-acetyltransferase
MAEVALRETIDADLGTLFEFQADLKASAMAAFPSRDRPAFLEHEAKIKTDPSAITRTIVAGGRVVGWIGSWEAEGERDVGFWIGRDHWGNGYATATHVGSIFAKIGVRDRPAAIVFAYDHGVVTPGMPPS